MISSEERSPSYLDFDFIHYNVLVLLSPEELYRHSLNKESPYTLVFQDKFFVEKLCERWNIRRTETFEDFLLLWDSLYLFSEDTSLEYQLERYTLTYTVSKAAAKASKNSELAFVEAILLKYPDHSTVISSIYKNYVYRENALELISNMGVTFDVVQEKFLRKGYDPKLIYPEKDNYGQNMIGVAVANIVFRRPIPSYRIVNILDIANFLKDPSVLTDPYYLNHPNVDADWTHEDLLAQNCHHLLRSFSVAETREAATIFLRKKKCKVFEEIGIPRDLFVSVHDEYSYRWLKENGEKYGYVVSAKKHDDIFLTITVKFVETNTSYEDLLTKKRTCPSFFNFIQEVCETL